MDQCDCYEYVRDELVSMASKIETWRPLCLRFGSDVSRYILTFVDIPQMLMMLINGTERDMLNTMADAMYIRKCKTVLMLGSLPREFDEALNDRSCPLFVVYFCSVFTKVSNVEILSSYFMQYQDSHPRKRMYTSMLLTPSLKFPVFKDEWNEIRDIDGSILQGNISLRKKRSLEFAEDIISIVKKAKYAKEV